MNFVCPRCRLSLKLNIWNCTVNGEIINPTCTKCNIEIGKINRCVNCPKYYFSKIENIGLCVKCDYEKYKEIQEGKSLQKIDKIKCNKCMLPTAKKEIINYLCDKCYNTTIRNAQIKRLSKPVFETVVTKLCIYCNKFLPEIEHKYEVCRACKDIRRDLCYKRLDENLTYKGFNIQITYNIITNNSIKDLSVIKVNYALVDEIDFLDDVNHDKTIDIKNKLLKRFYGMNDNDLSTAENNIRTEIIYAKIYGYKDNIPDEIDGDFPKMQYR